MGGVAAGVAVRLFVVATAALLLAELVVRPDATDRVHLVMVFGGITLVTAAATPLVLRRGRRGALLRETALTVAVTVIGIVALAVLVSAWLMFLSSEDLRLLIPLLGLSLGFAVVLADALTRPLVRDVERIAQAASAIAAGDLHVRTGVSKDNEIGAAARALDDLAARLAAVERDRQSLDEQRRLLLSSIGHDLRTPLTAIRAAVEALEDGVAPDPARYLAAVHRDLDALGALIDDLFLYTRLEHGELPMDKVCVDLTELADDAIDALSPTANRHGVHLALQRSSPAPVNGAPQAVGRAIRNLLDNAIRHSPPGGQVTVTVAPLGHDAKLTVTDTGPGFPPEFRAHAFEAFARSDTARTRTTGTAGLGLTIAKAIIDAHDGTITITPADHGQVELTLPSVSAGA
jgi:signal transduction histidine kinase